MARVAIVTGGSRGIGEAISLKLQEQGVTVVANYGGNDEKARAFTERTGIAAMKWDVGDHQACLDSCARIAEEFGPVDIVVNNAGITRDGTLARMSYDDWDDVMRVNLGGCFNMAKATFGGMVEPIWSGQLCRREIGHPRLYQGAGAGRRQEGRHRERDRAGLYRHRHGRGGAAAGAGKDRRQDSGGALGPGRRDRARRRIFVQRGCRVCDRVDDVDQWRAAYVLSE
jgi:NAD(P)-dependent dehydrogenase (short-subunit alcohol dehydrogenase family)